MQMEISGSRTVVAPFPGQVCVPCGPWCFPDPPSLGLLGDAGAGPGCPPAPGRLLNLLRTCAPSACQCLALPEHLHRGTICSLPLNLYLQLISLEEATLSAYVKNPITCSHAGMSSTGDASVTNPWATPRAQIILRDETKPTCLAASAR